MSFDLPEPFVELPPQTFDDNDLRASIAAIQQDLQALAERMGTVDFRRTSAGGFQSQAATGNVAITGAGFKPTLVRFDVIRNDSVTNGSGAITTAGGFMTASLQSAWFSSFDPNAPINLSRDWNGSFCLFVADRGNGSQYRASRVSFDADGFTFNVTSANSAYRVFWQAWR